MALEKGTTLAGYEITGILGQGGMGVVYEATQVSLNRTVALKVLAPHLSDDVLFRERFRREGQIQARIDHEHIVTVYEAGESPHGFFIAMRLIRGPNLKHLIASRELDAGRTLRILGPIAGALGVAHDAGLIHRDIKPQNILVGARDRAFLADFGLMKATGEESLTRTGQFVGTFDYISPEQIKGERATRRSDVYALAAVVYECLTGAVPYPKDSDAAVLYAQMSDPPPKITDQRPELPPALDAVIATGMAKDPAERYESADRLLAETGRALADNGRAASQVAPWEPVQAPEPPAPTELAAGGTAASPEPAVAASSATAPGETVRVKRRPRARPAPPVPEVETRAAGAGPARPAAAVAEAPAAGARRIPLVAGLALLAVIFAGVLIGRSSGGSDGEATSAARSSVSAGALELRYPDGWRRVASPPRIPGLDFKQRELALTREGSPRSDALVAGMTAATGPALLSQELLDRLGKPPARDDAVQLGDLDAYRYRDLRVRGFNGRPTLYVVPTTRGVATVACTARPAEAEAFLPSCEQVAGGLELVAGRAFPLGPDKRYLATLTRTIKRLNTSRKPHLRQLRGAERPAGQARAARAIAADYRRAERRLGRLQVSPAVKDASAAVRAALRRTEAAYRRLAAAAAAGDDAAFDDARRDVAAGDRALRRALRRVKAASR